MYENKQSVKLQPTPITSILKRISPIDDVIHMEDCRIELQRQNELLEIINNGTQQREHPLVTRKILSHHSSECPIQGCFEFKTLGRHKYLVDSETGKYYFFVEINSEENEVYASDTERVYYNPKDNSFSREEMALLMADDDEDEETFEANLATESRTALPAGDESTVLDYGKLVTELTVRVELVPKLKVLETGQYTAEELKVNALYLGDRDRPSTRFENQESHTSPWTLTREAMSKLQNISITDFLLRMEFYYNVLTTEQLTDEGIALLSMVVHTGLIDTLKTASFPIDVWIHLLSNLVVNFLQCYQQSFATTYKRGRAKGHGESSAMLLLRKSEFSIENGSPLEETEDSISVAARKLLDVAFTKSLTPLTYAHAVYHWIVMLQNAFPCLMCAHQYSIIAPVLDKPVAQSYLSVLGPDVDANMTVRNLLEHFKIGVGQPVMLQKIEAEPLPCDIPDLSELSTQFTANVILLPTMPQLFYSPDQLRVKDIRISDQDRPCTRFIIDQQSHTVPWTLARAAIMSFESKSLDALLDYITNEFVRLSPFVENENGKVVLAHAQTFVAELNAGCQLHHCMALVSHLIQQYFIVYQVSKITSYIHPQEMGQPLGHGEGSHMLCLRTNEASLEVGEGFLEDPKEVVEAALKLFDAQPTDTFPINFVIEAWFDFINKLTITFPRVMHLLGNLLWENRPSFLETAVNKTEFVAMNHICQRGTDINLKDESDLTLIKLGMKALFNALMEHRSPGVEGFLLTYIHWKRMIESLFPILLSDTGVALLEEHLSQPLPLWVLEELEIDGDRNLSIGDAIKDFTELREDISYAKLKKFIVQNGNILPEQEAVYLIQNKIFSSEMGVYVVLKSATTSKAPFQNISNLTIDLIIINDDTWMQAKYLADMEEYYQALPWGIMREWVSSFTGHSLSELYAALSREFEALAPRMIPSEEGSKAIQTAQAILAAADKPASKFQIMTNTCMLIRCFYIATQLDTLFLLPMQEEEEYMDIQSIEPDLQLMRIAEELLKNGLSFPLPPDFVNNMIDRQLARIPENKPRKLFVEMIQEKLRWRFPRVMQVSGMLWK